MTFPPKDVKLEYFPIQGRGEPIRLMLADLGITWSEAGLDHFKQKWLDCSEFPFNQVPRLTIDGKPMVQMNAILKYLAAISGQAGTGDLDQDLKCWMLEAATEDVHCKYTPNVYSPDYENLLTKFAQDMMPKFYAQFEYQLKQSKSTGGFFIYDKYPSAPEYSLFYIIGAISTLRPSLLAEYTLLSTWFKMFSERKGIKAYLDSGKQHECLNGNMNGNKKYC